MPENKNQIANTEQMLVAIGLKPQVKFSKPDYRFMDWAGTVNNGRVVIVERKSAINDAKKGLLQLLGYYEEFLSIYACRHSPGLPILVFYYDGNDILSIHKLFKLYQDYLYKDNLHFQILWVWKENDKFEVYDGKKGKIE